MAHGIPRARALRAFAAIACTLVACAAAPAAALNLPAPTIRVPAGPRPIAIGVAAVPTLRVLDRQPDGAGASATVMGGVVTELTLAFVWEGLAELGLRGRLGLPLGELGILAYGHVFPTCTAPPTTAEAGWTCFLVGGEAGYVAWQELMSESGPTYVGPEVGLEAGVRSEWLRVVSVSALARATAAHVDYHSGERGWVLGLDLVLAAEVRF